MELSNKLGVVTAVVGLALAACTSNEHGKIDGAGEPSPAPQASETLLPRTPAIVAHEPGALRSPEVTLGASLEADHSIVQFAVRLDEERSTTPAGASGDGRIVLREEPTRATDTYTNVYTIWDIRTGDKVPGWQAPPNKQDVLGEATGDWLVTVRMGMSLPFEDWQLILRNLSTGETREIARSDPETVQIPDLPVRLPTGFAPNPSVSGDRVVWSEFITGDAGSASLRVQMYDLSTSETTTLISVDPKVDDIWQPSIGGGRVAWVHRPPSGRQELVVMNLTSREIQTFPVGGEIYSCALSQDGRYLAWDDNYLAKYALDLESRSTVQYAADEGWGTVRSGHFVSWQPSTVSYTDDPPIYNGDGGFYDFDKREVRFASQGSLFDKAEMRALAGVELSLTHDNKDDGVAHNWALYTSEQAVADGEDPLFGTDIETGLVVQTLTFGPLDTGEYYYQCDVHPGTMFGTLIVEEGGGAPAPTAETPAATPAAETPSPEATPAP